jgi:hypothetical protein
MDNAITDWNQIVRSAEGYLDLGMLVEACEELDGLPFEWTTRIEVIGLRTAIYSEAENWSMMRDLSEVLVKRCPEESAHWIWFAFATRRSRSIMEAQAILVDALKHHDLEPTIHFNLACYACLAGDLPLARERLARACLLEPKKHEVALKDSDLKPLWAELGKFKGGK